MLGSEAEAGRSDDHRRRHHFFVFCSFAFHRNSVLNFEVDLGLVALARIVSMAWTAFVSCLLLVVAAHGAVDVKAGNASVPDHSMCSSAGGHAPHHQNMSITHRASYKLGKDLLPLEWPDIVGAILAVFMAAFANAGGIGGGGLFVPLLVLVFGLEVQYAIPLSKVMVFGGALTRFLSTIKAKHPYADRPGESRV